MDANERGVQLRRVRLRDVHELELAGAEPRARLLYLEQQIRYSRTEIALIVNAHGRLIQKIRGDRWKVDVSNATGLLLGQTLTHNHPQNTGPSIQDVLTLLDYRLAELRVVTAPGAISLTMPQTPPLPRTVEVFAQQQVEVRVKQLLSGLISREQYIWYKTEGVVLDVIRFYQFGWTEEMSDEA